MNHEPLDRRIRLRLELDDFRAWLQTLDPQESAGVAGNSGWCPLARYLRAHGLKPDVGGGLWAPTKQAKFRPMPGWAVQVVEWVDQRADRSPVLAGELLAYVETLDATGS